MAERPKQHTLAELRLELAEKSRLLSELDVMLADYHSERARLIRDLRRLQTQLREAEERRREGPAASA